VRERPTSATVTKLSLKLAQNRQKSQQTPRNQNRRYLAAGKGIYLIFLPDSEPAI